MFISGHLIVVFSVFYLFHCWLDRRRARRDWKSWIAQIAAEQERLRSQH